MSLNIALKHTCFFIQGFAVALGVCELIQGGPAVSLGSGFLGLADACSIPGLVSWRRSIGLQARVFGSYGGAEIGTALTSGMSALFCRPSRKDCPAAPLFAEVAEVSGKANRCQQVLWELSGAVVSVGDIGQYSGSIRSHTFA